MPTIDLNLTGGTHTSRSRPLSAQVTRNFYPEPQDTRSARSTYVLHSFPGLALFNSKTGPDRGLLAHRGSLYHVSGPTLYSVNSGGQETSLGTIPGTGRCIMQGMGANVVVTTQGVAYQYNGSTVSTITDSDLETPQSCAHINNQMVYDGDGGRFGVSDVGDATSINGLNYATAEVSPDNLKRVYAFNQLLYLFGERTIETWYNSGVGNPPFDRVQGGVIQIGLDAIHAVAHNDNFLYWLGDDREVYAASGNTAQRVSDTALSYQFAQPGAVSDAIGWCFSLNGRNYYTLTLPGADKTWVYQEGGAWFELSSGVSGGRWLANSHAYFAGKNIVADYRNGNLYSFDESVYTENGTTVRRVRDTAPLHGGMMGAPGKPIEMGRFELLLETGVGIISGQGSDPEIMLSYSDDGGRTFSTERRGHIGVSGDYLRRVEWFNLGRFRSRIFRVAVSDPVPISIYSAAADVEVGV